MASGIIAQSVAVEFLQHANEEQGYADQLAERIVQLSGKPNLSPDGMPMRSHSEYVEGTSLVDMIKEDLVAERIVIDSYREMINYLDTNDRHPAKCWREFWLSKRSMRMTSSRLWRKWAPNNWL